MEGKDVLAKVREDGRDILTVEESKLLLEENGIEVNRSLLARDAGEARRFGKELGFPVVMKIVSPEIVHKTDIGGVRVGIRDADEVEAVFEEMVKSARRGYPKAQIEGVLIEEQVEGTEMIVGCASDPTFGHLLMFGIGGVFVEVFEDVSFRVVPIEMRDALDMIDEIEGKALIDGARGRKATSREKIAGCLLKVSRMIESHPEIEEMDINPLMGAGNCVVAVDARFRIRWA